MANIDAPITPMEAVTPARDPKKDTLDLGGRRVDTPAGALDKAMGELPDPIFDAESALKQNTSEALSQSLDGLAHDSDRDLREEIDGGLRTNMIRQDNLRQSNQAAAEVLRRRHQARIAGTAAAGTGEPAAATGASASDELPSFADTMFPSAVEPATTAGMGEPSSFSSSFTAQEAQRQADLIMAGTLRPGDVKAGPAMTDDINRLLAARGYTGEQIKAIDDHLQRSAAATGPATPGGGNTGAAAAGTGEPLAVIEPEARGVDSQAAVPEREDTGATKESDKTPGRAEADKRQRMNELETKFKENKVPMTVAELNELRQLRQEGIAYFPTPQEELQDIKNKLLDPSLTDADREKLGDRYNDLLRQTSPETAETLRQQLETEAEKKVNELGRGLVESYLKGDVNMESLRELQSLIGQQVLSEITGFTPDQAAEAWNFFKKSKLAQHVESALETGVRKLLNEMMGIEMQVLVAPGTLDQINDAEKETLQTIAKMEQDLQLKNVDLDDEKRRKQRGEINNQYMKLASLRSRKMDLATSLPKLEAQYSNLQRQVRFKLGLMSPWAALVAWGGSQTRKISAEIQSKIQSQLPSQAYLANYDAYTSAKFANATEAIPLKSAA